MSTKSSELFCKPCFLEAGSHISDERELEPKRLSLFWNEDSWRVTWTLSLAKCVLSFPIPTPSPAPAAMMLLCQLSKISFPENKGDFSMIRGSWVQMWVPRSGQCPALCYIGEETPGLGIRSAKFNSLFCHWMAVWLWRSGFLFQLNSLICQVSVLA